MAKYECEDFYDIAAIGGGAGGFASVISAAGINPALKVILLEGSDRTGKKIAASGNGQGNIANKNLSINNYHVKDTKTAESVFKRVPLYSLLEFYTSLGISLTEKENGRIYPKSLQASSVLDCLRLKAAELGIKEVCGFFAADIKKDKDIFIITGSDGKKVFAKAAVVSCGGTASPHLSCGTGYNLLTTFGHKLTPLMPSLVQLTTGRENIKFLKGLKIDSAVSVVSNGKIVKTSRADVIFTDYGVSGSAVFEVSGAAVRELSAGANVMLNTDMMPDTDLNDLVSILMERRNIFCRRAAANFFTGFLLKQFAKTVLLLCGIDGAKMSGDLTDKEIEKAAACIKNFSLNVTGSAGLSNAQVTAGGIETSGFDGNLMSKFCKNLYACGEMLDIDGDCGGFNLMWAFASGIVCGESAAKAISK